MFTAFILMAIFLTSQALAEDLRIKINSGQVEPMPVAIANFTGLAGQSSVIGRKISEVISNNLIGSGQFKAVESAAFIAPPTSPSVRPNFSDWTPLGIKALITGSVKKLNENQVEIEFRLWDVIAETDLIGLRLLIVSTMFKRSSGYEEEEIRRSLKNFKASSGDCGRLEG